MSTLSLTIIEIIVLMSGAIMLGVVVNYVITTRRSFKTPVVEKEKISKTVEEWKLRYFNDTELRDKELAHLRKRVDEAEDNNHINTIEVEETKKLNKQLRAELELLKKQPQVVVDKDKPDYVERLKQAQESLLEHNAKINKLLSEINLVKEAEEKQRELTTVNEQLSSQVEELRSILAQKEKEIDNTKQKQQIANEMTSMIDSAYNEFSVLQDKIQKLEGQANASRKMNLEFEDLKENHYRISKEYEDLRRKFNTVSSERKRLQDDLTETEDKLKEANFQRQQLQKRVSYLEELNNDMQVVAEANKKLEGQLKRVAELESMLNVVAEERDELAKKHKM